LPGIDPPVPYQWSVTDVANAAILNAQIFNGLTFLLNPPIFVGYMSPSGQSIPNNAVTDLNLDTVLFDSEAGHSPTNSARYVCQRAGIYQLSGGVTFQAVNTTGLRMAEFRINGTIVPPGGEGLAPPSSTQLSTITPPTTYVRLNVGDYVTLAVLQTSGSPVNVGQAGGGTQTMLSCLWVSL
jgi:hypothetical protein